MVDFAKHFGSLSLLSCGPNISVKKAEVSCQYDW